MQLDDFCFDGKGTFSLDDYPTNAKIPKAQRERYEALMQENIDRMADLQDRLYAEGREGVVIMFQAMDAAGKDSTIKRVMTGLNPQGVNVYSFKQPTHEELAHDFLWRAVTHLPRVLRGRAGGARAPDAAQLRHAQAHHRHERGRVLLPPAPPDPRL